MKLKLDLHVHTTCSPDSSISIRQLLTALRDLSLDGAAITDHDAVSAIKEAERLAYHMDLLIIPGVEVTTSQGDIIILGLRSPPILKDAWQLINEAKKQGGITIAAHPFDPERNSLMELCFDLNLDALEVLNAKSKSYANREAQRAAQLLGKPGVGGSDAHRVEGIGAAFTEVCCNDFTVNSVLQSILKGEVRASRLKI
ncbi:MAG: PHP domain-containing protein [Candidatus Verstraetearchaeota archaeon]|nr:PHP domain-containing protein [Candidatus Verstraetearchaeota archaeon]